MQPPGFEEGWYGFAAQRREAAVTVPVMPHAAKPRALKHVGGDGGGGDGAAAAAAAAGGVEVEVEEYRKARSGTSE